jgi:hypothetical protein
LSSAIDVLSRLDKSTESEVISTAFWENGDPGRIGTHRNSKHLFWQTYLSAFTEPNEVFGALANRGGRHVASA